MDGDSGSKRRFTIIGVSSVILVACVVALAVGVHHQNTPSEKTGSSDGQLSTSSKAVEALCQPTDYKEACEKSLSSAGNTTDPKELVKIAFNYTMTKIGEQIEKSTTIKELEKDPRGKMAIEDCKELIDYAVDDLKHAIDKLCESDKPKIDEIVTELQIWLSAAGSYQEACLDGFQNTTGAAGEKMRKALNTTRQLTSNALAMVTSISTMLSQLDIEHLFNRKLLASQAQKPLPHGMPRWVDHHTRRALLGTVTPTVTVAQDGSGQYKTITEALKMAPKRRRAKSPFIIYIKAGIYKENIFIEKEKTHIMIYGDGPMKTKITGNKNFADGTPTFETATVAVVGDYFIAKDIGFENTAGAVKHQAVALRVTSDRSVFFNCRIDGYQNTLFALAERQFYRDCTITGTVDFIFGDAAAVFQHCTFLVRKPIDDEQLCTVTAQGRSDKNSNTAFIIQNGTISADPTLIPAKNDTVKTTNTVKVANTLKVANSVKVSDSDKDDDKDDNDKDDDKDDDNDKDDDKSGKDNESSKDDESGKDDDKSNKDDDSDKDNDYDDDDDFDEDDIIQVYLGRPAKAYSRTIIVNTQIDDLIQPKGWLPFRGDFGTKTCFYAELNNTGPGADKSKRVKWEGIKNLDATEASEFAPIKFFQGDTWIADADVPYTSSLII